MSNGATAAAGDIEGLRDDGRQSWAGLLGLAIGSIGVVYGDIGTSPLYALREAVNAAAGPDAAPTPEAVFGVVSLILWALIFVVTIKYVVVLLRADNNGEAQQPGPGLTAVVSCRRDGSGSSSGALRHLASNRYCAAKKVAAYNTNAAKASTVQTTKFYGLNPSGIGGSSRISVIVTRRLAAM